MPRLIMLCGPSGSGKTTFRDNLKSQNSNAVVISSDDILEEWASADGITYQEAYQRYATLTPSLIQDILAIAYDQHREIIWDQGNLTRDHRQKLLEQVPDDYMRVAVAFEAPIELLKDRVRNRMLQTGKHVPEDVVTHQFEKYELPDYDEGYDNIICISQPSGSVRVL